MTISADTVIDDSGLRLAQTPLIPVHECAAAHQRNDQQQRHDHTAYVPRAGRISVTRTTSHKYDEM